MPGTTDLAHLQGEALKRWGHESQMTKLQEECGELVAAVSRYFHEDATLEDVYEEAVGVRSVLDSLHLFFDEELPPSERLEIRTQQARKLARALGEEAEIDA